MSSPSSTRSRRVLQPSDGDVAAGDERHWLGGIIVNLLTLGATRPPGTSLNAAGQQRVRERLARDPLAVKRVATALSIASDDDG